MLEARIHMELCDDSDAAARSSSSIGWAEAGLTMIRDAVDAGSHSILARKGARF